MTEHPLTILLLSLLVGCAVIVTGILLSLLSDLRRVLDQLNEILPQADLTFREASQSLHHTRLILSRADDATKVVGGLVERTCDVWSQVVDQLSALKDRAQRLFKNGHKNGHQSRAGAEPRLHRGKR